MTDTMAKILADGAALDAALEELGGDVSDGADAIIAEWFAELDERRAEKVDGYGFRIKQEQADAAKWKALADELYAKAKAADNRAKYLLARMQYHMEEQAVTEMKGEVWTFKFQQNGGKAPLVLASENPDDYPEDCRVTTVTINKDAIRAKLEAGETLPASIGERGRSLRLR